MANLKMIKHRLLHCRYGKFDEVEILFHEKELLHLKPRIIWERMISKLGLELGTINRVSFYSWLSRYRSKKKSLQEKIANKNSWKDFNITDPSTLNPASHNDDVNFLSVNYKK